MFLYYEAAVVRFGINLNQHANDMLQVRSVAVVGGGVLGAGIAACFLSNGVPTVVVEDNSHRLAQAEARVRACLGLPRPRVDRDNGSRERSLRLATFTLVGFAQVA